MRKQKDNGNAFCESVASFMTSLIEKRDFAGAVSYYESNRTLVAKVGGHWAGKILHQTAKAYASLTNYPSALKAARTAQAVVSEEGDSVLLANIFVTLGGILRDSGEFVEAQKAFRDAESIFRRNDCPEGQSRALNLLAGLYFRRTDYRNALSVLMDAVEIAKKLDDNRKLAYMMGNVGRLHTFMGDFPQAERHLQINIDLSVKLNDKLEVARARLSLGYVYLQQGQHDRSRDEFEKAHALIQKLGAKREEIMYLTYIGELAYRTNRFEESKEALEQAVMQSEESFSDRSLAGRALRHLAELYLRMENYRLAGKTASRATVIMQQAGDSVELGALLKIKAVVADHVDKPERARKLFKKAMDILEESGVRWEKAEALVAAGSSECFKDRQRMTYLFRAEEFYARARLTRPLDEVSRIISGLGQFPVTSAAHLTPVRAKKEHDYITASPEIKKIKHQLPLLGQSDLPILITGETGVGKDHLARFFHAQVCPEAPYVAINCASVPETLLESELFGYRKGAFTGAGQDKKGLLIAANGGVLLLDEIGDMPLSLQAKLLGVLESRKVIPLGGTEEVDIDIKLVAATNRNLEDMVEEGTFRRDLYYRLSGITFELPPLRERKEDIPLLLEHFMIRRGLLKKGRKLPVELLQQFIGYDWPGNVRELDNKVKRLEVMSQLVAEGDLGEVARSMFENNQPDNDPVSLFERVEQFERRLITEALLAAGGNKSEAARMLGVHEATVRTKLKRYQIALPEMGGAPN